MKQNFLMFAKHFQEKNETIYELLDALSNEEREKDRGSYYKSLSGLFRHVLSGACFFFGLFHDGLGEASSAAKALKPVLGLKIADDGSLPSSEWKLLNDQMTKIDAAFVNFASALTPAEINKEIPAPIFGGKPPAVPLNFLMNEFITHFVHHEGQISQILDEMKIEHNYSGINVALCELLSK